MHCPEAKDLPNFQIVAIPPTTELHGRLVTSSFFSGLRLYQSSVESVGMHTDPFLTSYYYKGTTSTSTRDYSCHLKHGLRPETKGPSCLTSPGKMAGPTSYPRGSALLGSYWPGFLENSYLSRVARPTTSLAGASIPGSIIHDIGHVDYLSLIGPAYQVLVPLRLEARANIKVVIGVTDIYEIGANHYLMVAVVGFCSITFI